MAQLSMWLIVMIMVAAHFISGIRATSCPGHVNQVPQGYTVVHKHTCYLFVNKELYWDKARDACWDLGGEMLTVERNDTMEFIKTILSSRELGWDKNGVWLGAKLESGTWRWANGKVMTYTDWAENQPRTFLGRTLLDCVLMRHEGGWKWHNSVCSFAKFHYNYICQFPLNKHGDSARRVSTSQAEASGNSQILALIAGITVSLVFIVATIFLVLFLHRRCRKQSQNQTAAHFSNNVYPRASVRSTHPVYQPTSLLTNETVFPSSDHLYMMPSEMMNSHELHEAFLVNSRNYSLIQTRTCNCVYQPPNISPEFETLGNVEPKTERQPALNSDEDKTELQLARVRRTPGECLHCCHTANQGDYIDMRICGLLGNAGCTRLDNKRHVYSNINQRDGENDNYYEVLQCK